MESMLEPVAEFIRVNHGWAGLVLGLFIMLESMVILGAFIPATPMLVLTGGLLATGVLDPVSVLLGCITGAIIGDAISYFIGRRLGMRVLRHRWLKRYRRQFALTRLYCRRFGVITIYVGRFIGPMRAFVPAGSGFARLAALALPQQLCPLNVRTVLNQTQGVPQGTHQGQGLHGGLARGEAQHLAHGLTDAFEPALHQFQVALTGLRVQVGTTENFQGVEHAAQRVVYLVGDSGGQLPGSCQSALGHGRGFGRSGGFGGHLDLAVQTRIEALNLLRHGIEGTHQIRQLVPPPNFGNPSREISEPQAPRSLRELADRVEDQPVHAEERRQGQQDSGKQEPGSGLAQDGPHDGILARTQPDTPPEFARSKTQGDGQPPLVAHGQALGRGEPDLGQDRFLVPQGRAMRAAHGVEVDPSQTQVRG